MPEFDWYCLLCDEERNDEGFDFQEVQERHYLTDHSLEEMQRLYYAQRLTD